LVFRGCGLPRQYCVWRITHSTAPARRDQRYRRDERGRAARSRSRRSLSSDPVRLVIGRLPRFHFPGDLSTDYANLAEKLIAGSVQPIQILIGSHRFGAIQPNYRPDGNLNPAVVTPQTVNLANHGSLSHRPWNYISGGAVAETGPEKAGTPGASGLALDQGAGYERRTDPAMMTR
jgi:YD repeat-containing protein